MTRQEIIRYFGKISEDYMDIFLKHKFNYDEIDTYIERVAIMTIHGNIDYEVAKDKALKLIFKERIEKILNSRIESDIKFH